MLSTTSPMLRPAPFRSTAVCAALALALPAAVHAQQQVQPAAVAQAGAQRDFSIPAGPLAATLQAISRISGKRVQFEEADVKGLQAPAISGQTSEQGAVQAAISGSGLTMNTGPDGSIRVFVQQLAAVAVTAKRDEAETGFRASSSSTATRGGADLLDVPQSVTVLTAKVLETQQSATVEEALRNVAGVVVQPATQGASGFSIRGFGTSASTLSNGLSDPNSYKTNIAGVERIEVLKGPQALLSGANGLGGTLNIVTKKPTAERIRDLSVKLRQPCRTHRHHRPGRRDQRQQGIQLPPDRIGDACRRQLRGLRRTLADLWIGRGALEDRGHGFHRRRVGRQVALGTGQIHGGGPGLHRALPADPSR
ncbi:TonB-dependent receptor plug domain-containing protein [Paracidovorax avenae]|uniref:TonB-dependent receptor plug domain-containing protein n=1 Tax=Paracidovorax avenae TaxID=80867 RepID=UPI001CEF9B34|nr:TonB-dependent receptor plug domain-containing protein [Paracidovorax avenae]